MSEGRADRSKDLLELAARLNERYPKFSIEDLRAKLEELGWGDLLKYPPVETSVLGRLCEMASETVQAAIYRKTFKKGEPTLTLEDLTASVLKGEDEEIGYKNTDVPRIELMIGAYHYDSPYLANYFREQGVPLPEEVADLKQWARSFKIPEEPISQDGRTGLYERPFRTETGDLRGIPTRIEGIQLEIDGAANGPGRPCLRISRLMITQGIATLLNQEPGKPINIQKVTVPQFGQRA